VLNTGGCNIIGLTDGTVGIYVILGDDKNGPGVPGGSPSLLARTGLKSSSSLCLMINIFFTNPELVDYWGNTRKVKFVGVCIDH